MATCYQRQIQFKDLQFRMGSDTCGSYKYLFMALSEDFPQHSILPISPLKKRLISRCF